MVLIDTTVWIDFFAGTPTPQVSVLELLISEGEDVCTCGIVLAEVLQGIRNDRTYRKTRSYFENLVYLPMNQGVFVKSADMYRALRRKGITIRKPLDCMIASVAIVHRAQLLHNDRDFAPIQKQCGLKVVKIRKR
ncbi:MAG: PIN domain nuclease [Kiritimatiellae bacterium]|nr:PIN domain nuclease [Kiritimatiellia bacterium]